MLKSVNFFILQLFIAWYGSFAYCLYRHKPVRQLQALVRQECLPEQIKIYIWIFMVVDL